MNTTNPMKREYSFQKAPRCTATSKRTKERCRAPAMRGWKVCRFHGAGGGAPQGPAHGNYKHGGRTHKTREDARRVREIVQEARSLMETIKEKTK